MKYDSGSAAGLNLAAPLCGKSREAGKGVHLPQAADRFSWQPGANSFTCLYAHQLSDCCGAGGIP